MMSRGKCRPEKMPMALIISRRSFYCPNFATAPPRTEDVAYTAASSIVIATGSMSASGYGLTTEMNAPRRRWRSSTM